MGFLVLLVGLFVLPSAFAKAPSLNIDPNLVQQLSYVVATYTPYTPLKFGTPPKWTYCNCVEYAKYLLGKEGESWGIARTIKPNTKTPVIGDVMLTSESSLGHVRVIIDETETAWLTDEANVDVITHIKDGAVHKDCKPSKRWINKDDPFIRGYRKVL